VAADGTKQNVRGLGVHNPLLCRPSDHHPSRLEDLISFTFFLYTLPVLLYELIRMANDKGKSKTTSKNPESGKQPGWRRILRIGKKPQENPAKSLDQEVADTPDDANTISVKNPARGQVTDAQLEESTSQSSPSVNSPGRHQVTDAQREEPTSSQASVPHSSPSVKTPGSDQIGEAQFEESTSSQSSVPQSNVLSQSSLPSQYKSPQMLEAEKDFESSVAKLQKIMLELAKKENQKWIADAIDIKAISDFDDSIKELGSSIGDFIDRWAKSQESKSQVKNFAVKWYKATFPVMKDIFDEIKASS
jgi:hypothetical protein